MASVSSLDKDMRNIRLSKYTPQAANEARTWIEDVLGEPLATGDLLNALKDGVALCKLVNLAAPPGVRFKQSSMPFVQMENISNFLRACQAPPLKLQSHDIFQTVDLYESKDPAQVLQCIAAFSRIAHSVQPSRFPNTIGEKPKAGVVTPQSTGGYSASGPLYRRARGASNVSEASSTISQQASQATGRGTPSRLSETSPSSSANGKLAKSSSGAVSSWSKKADEGATIPAWNIHQYGYMGGASQGNQGITFGGRRQITTPAPNVPSFTEKQRKKREQEAEAERLRVQAEEAEQKRRAEREAEEERERLAEEQRWEEEVRRRTEQERLRAEEEKRQWEAEERKWGEEEEARAQQEKEAEEARMQAARDHEAKLVEERERKRAEIDARLRSQPPVERSPERDRVKELERQLEEAKEREAQYERERRERVLAFHNRQVGRFGDQETQSPDQVPNKSSKSFLPSHQSNGDGADELEYLRKEWSNGQAAPGTHQSPAQPPRPLPTPQKSTPAPASSSAPAQAVAAAPSPTPSLPPPSSDPHPSRPLPNPATYTAPRTSTSPQRKSPFARPSSPQVSSSPQEQKPTPPATTATNPLRKPPFANPSSLLSREMELDRQRQQEWEESQKATKGAVDAGVGKGEGGTGPGDGAWDVHQYGYLGGDSQNRGSTGIGFGSGRRQLVGPRERPGR